MILDFEKPERPIQEPAQETPLVEDQASRYEATHDSLTGLLNRRGLEEELDNLLTSYPGQFAVLRIDLDGMKEINDSSGGHEAGDAYLQKAAIVMQNTVRQKREEDGHDIITKADLPGHSAREGGDEFTILLPGIEKEEQLDVVRDRLRTNFEEAGVEASIGGAVHRIGEPEEMTALDVLGRADTAMYGDKVERKLARYTPEQLRLIQRIGEVATRSGVNLRDVGVLLPVLQGQDTET